MSRPAFSVNLHGSLVRTSSSLPSPVTTGIADAVHSEEQTSGVSRHRPGGWLQPLPYSLTSKKYRRAVGRTKYTHVWGSWTEENGVVGYQPGGRFNSLNHFNDIVLEGQIRDPSLKNAALIAARTKMKKADVNLGVAFAERNATARLLGDTASNIGRAFRELRKGRTRNAMRLLGLSSREKEPRGSNVPQKWLELQYGWKPMLSDVYGACQALEREPYADWRVTARSLKRSEEIWTRTWSREQAGSGWAEAKRSNFTRLDALPTNDLIGSMASLGITNPLLIGWELVPYSFVVDWALPIGAWLESLDALLGYSSAYYSSSDYTKCVWIDKGIRYEEPGWGVAENEYEGSKEVVFLSRTTSNSIPLPTFPRLKDPRSLGHMANGLSLLVSAFRR